MNQEFLRTGLDKQLCEALGCNDNATNKIQVKVGKNGWINLFVCKRCTNKLGDENKTQIHKQWQSSPVVFGGSYDLLYTKESAGTDGDQTNEPAVDFRARTGTSDGDRGSDILQDV